MKLLGSNDTKWHIFASMTMNVFFCMCFNVQRFQYLDYIAPNGIMINEWWTGKDLEVSGLGIIEEKFRHVNGGTV
jgi:hypothetical protein